MRDIKFRAWDKEGNQSSGWKPQMVYSGIHGEWEVKIEDSPGSLMPMPYKSKRFEWMQFTGLHDKNGKEIYEGDVIQSLSSSGCPIQHFIVFKSDVAQFVAEYDQNTKLSGYSTISQKWIDEFKKEIIGNIYSNPELLEKKEKQ